jgi:putative transcriptional regulator
MSPQNIQRIEQGEAKSLTFATLERLCEVLHCQPGDILIYDNETGETGNDDSNTEL